MHLADWLKAENKTQEWLGEQLGMSQTGVSRIVNGGDTSFTTLRRINELTNGAVSPNWMVLGKAA